MPNTKYSELLNISHTYMENDDILSINQTTTLKLDG